MRNLNCLYVSNKYSYSKIFIIWGVLAALLEVAADSVAVLEVEDFLVAEAAAVGKFWFSKLFYLIEFESKKNHQNLISFDDFLF